MNKVLALYLVLCVSAASAAETVLEFDSAQQQSRFHELIEELRCMVCQNQNLADSNAELAQDLRNRVYDMIRAGRTDEFIVGHLVERYGDFVLYRPPVKSTTLLLWLGPLIFLLLAGLTIWIYTRRTSRRPELVMSEDERRHVQDILDQ